MKARPKGHIAIRLFKVPKEHLTTTKNSSQKCCAAALCNNRSDNRIIYFQTIFAEGQFLHCPISNARSFTVTAPGISLGVNYKSLNHKLFLFSPLYLLFFKFARNMVAIRPRFHAYVISGYIAR